MARYDEVWRGGGHAYSRVSRCTGGVHASPVAPPGCGRGGWGLRGLAPAPAAAAARSQRGAASAYVWRMRQPRGLRYRAEHSEPRVSPSPLEAWLEHKNTHLKVFGFYDHQPADRHEGSAPAEPRPQQAGEELTRHAAETHRQAEPSPRPRRDQPRLPETTPEAHRRPSLPDWDARSLGSKMSPTCAATTPV